MITCQDLECFIIDYLEGTLPTLQRRRFELHLRICRDCRRYLEAYKRAITLSQAAFREDDSTPAEAMPEDLVKAILAARREST